jgi:GTP 3',8-cyclase
VTSTSPLPDPVLRRPDPAPGTGGLVDRHGRVATDLRVSLTDRCNLRCTYCMPPEGLDWLPKVEVLTDEEIARLVRIGVEQLGIREVRFTGGEPLLRPAWWASWRPPPRWRRGPRSA